MIEKRSYFRGLGPDGRPTCMVVRPGGSDLVKTAGYGFLSEINSYLANLQPDLSTLYVLVTALTASEYYGLNTNGDHFPESALRHDGPMFGHKTFLNANVFSHHQNGDSARGYGKVTVAAWNPFMKRVELVLAINRDKARYEGSQDVVDRIDCGEAPDTSMGTRVPYDLCLVDTDWDRITGNAERDLAEHKRRPIRGLSVTRNDYCEHLRTMMGRILPNGVRVGMVNLHPRFFDISFVFIGAEKTSKTMAPLASHGRKLGSGLVLPIRSPGQIKTASCGVAKPPDMVKVAAPVGSLAGRLVAGRKKPMAVRIAEPLIRFDAERRAFLEAGAPKVSSHGKLGEITKEVIPQDFARKAIQVVTRQEPDLPNPVLDDLGKAGLPKALSTSGMLGIVLKPREFQRITLISIGRPEVAEGLDRQNQVFGSSGRFDESVPFGSRHFDPELARMLGRFVQFRSCFAPPLHRRILSISITKPVESGPEASPTSTPLLDKIGAAYNGYRRQLVESIAVDAPTTMGEHPWLWQDILGDQFLTDSLLGIEKMGSDVHAAKVLLSVIPILYLLAAHIAKTREREAEGQPVGELSRMIAENPTANTMLAAGALRHMASELITRL